jgi:hypothetical protein
MYNASDYGTPGDVNDVVMGCPPDPCGIVCLDIKPDSDVNKINLKSKGVIPVALMGSSRLDVNDIDPATVTFGPGAAPEAHKVMIHYEDVNMDGVMDAVFHFRTQESGLLPGDIDACIYWEDWNGNAFSCCDSVTTFSSTDDPGAPGLSHLEEDLDLPQQDASKGIHSADVTGFGCGGSIGAPPMGPEEFFGGMLPLMLLGLALVLSRAVRLARVGQ